MKNSLTESRLEKSLLELKAALYSDEMPYKKLLLELKKDNFALKSAYILDYIPEQGEDIYILITDQFKVVVIELERNNFDSQPLSKEIIHLEEYKKKLTKTNRIQLQIAVDLLKNDMKLKC